MIVFGYRFEPKLWTIILTVCLTVIFVELGKWQLSRADEKETQYAQLEQYAKEPNVTLPGTVVKLEDFQYREIEVNGEFLHEHTIYLDNKTHQGRAGYHIITPLKIQNSSLSVIINRGWIATGPDRSILPIIPEIMGMIKITGIVTSPELRTLKLSDSSTEGKVWDNFNLRRYEEITELALHPIMVLQKNKTNDELIRNWDKPDSGANKNIGYAIQWFSLAVTTVIIFLVLNVKRKNSKIE